MTTSLPLYSYSGIRRLPIYLCILLCLLQTAAQAQVSPPVTATTRDHHKQVIGYITQWDAWKTVANLVPEGGYNQLNVDYSQYTMLNFCFFGVADDGSLHSGDYRNQNIYQVGTVQAPAPLVDSDTYSSWDMYLLYGQLETVYYISDGSDAYNLGFRNQGSGWQNINTGASGAFPLSFHQPGGAPGVIDLAHQKGIKVMASVGGWSMCKHYPDVAASATMRAKFVASCQTLIAMGFDGIDFDWEYPNDPGMDIVDYSPADYTNFAVLVEQVRAAIGSSKLITACFSAAPAKLTGFDWARLNNSMDYFNMMTYDYNGGWSNKAGHNAPLYDYPGEEVSNFSVNATVQQVKTLNVNLAKVNIGAAFYGRGVITAAPAVLNGATTKRAETIQPDGPIQTCADYTNWGYWDGTPNYSYIVQTTTSGWTQHWDSTAQVPYMTNGNYFLSYDNPQSIGLKAQYVKDNNLAGIIVWQVYGDMTNMTSSTVAEGKLIYCPNTTSPLVNKINAVFAAGGTTNTPPTVSLTAPANNSTYTAPASITISASAGDADGSVAKVDFYNGATLLGTDSTSPYTYTWNNVAAGTYSIMAKATDNAGASTTSTSVSVTVTGSTTNIPPTVSLTAPASSSTYTAPASITITASASDADGSVTKVDFYNGATLLGTDATSPYTYTWSNVAAGTYSITAKATDNAGATTTSTAVSVTVNANSGSTVNCTGVATYQPYPKVYNNGDLVVYNGILYQSLSNSLYNVTPGTADWWWKPLGTCAASPTALLKNAAGDSEGTTQSIGVYPNPVTGGNLQVTFDAGNGENLEIALTDISGHQPLLKKKYVAGTAGRQNLTLDISGVPSGIWLLTIVHPATGVTQIAKVIRLR